MAKSTWQIIEDRATALKELYDRMDETKDLLYMEPYKLKSWDGKRDLDKVINVTGNNPAVFANAIVSDLMGAKWQTVIEGDISSRQAHEIEQFIEDNFAQADEMLLNNFGLSSLYSWLCNHVCVRSLIGVRWLSLVEKGQYKVDCVPCDMRWTPYQFGNENFKWVAPITFRSKEDLEGEFPGQSIVGKTDIEVRDYWDDKKNEVWTSKSLLSSQDNPLGKPPFVIVLPASGFMLRDKGYLKHEAEDLFFLNKQLYDELNRTLSVEQTFAFRQLYPGYEYETADFDGKPARPAPKTGEAKKVPKGERHEIVPTGDMNKASVVARQDIQTMIERGGPTLPREYRQPPSAVELYAEVELLSKLLKPRLEALQIMRQGLARLMIEQFIKSSEAKSELLVGKTGKKNRYSVKNLGDPDKYTITCELMTRNKKLEIANWALANAARGTAPLKIIVRDILKAEDPDGWIRELNLEEARKADPAIALFEMALRYAEEAEDLEDEADADAKKIQSKMLTERGVAVIRERKAPMPTTELPEKARVPQIEERKGNMQGLIPLLGQKGMAGAKQPSEEA